MNKYKDLWWGPITMVMLLAVISWATWSLKTGRQLNSADLIIGGIMMRLSTMLDYRYGSSKSSDKKTDLLTKNNNDENT